MSATYSYAPAVAEIGRRLVAKHHRHLLDNGNVRIEYVFRSEAAKSGGKTIWGKARKLGGLNAFLSLPKDEAPSGDPGEDIESFFCIEIAWDVWQLLNKAQRTALVDHELEHCQVEEDPKTGEPKLSLRGHDIEEFESILRRHGLFRPDLKNFAIVASEQLSLLGDITTGEVGDVAGAVMASLRDEAGIPGDGDGGDTRLQVTLSRANGSTETVETTMAGLQRAGGDELAARRAR